ncbi:MAG TPA: response regulator transcription factor [Candidatus Deferrimicrobiaceae bacterium]|jgi:DNA-binding response OmpR family regulator|nr:response regulator transcription factor [Candidatus Deferrimicrobiaceae bacterium]
MSRNVLVVEDDKDIARLLDLHLKDEGYSVTVVSDGKTGLAQALSKPYDIVILDLILPGMDGLEVCRGIRNRKDYTPILMLTAKSTDVDRIVGLEMGADDYLTKPFNVRELLARVKALFRRVEALRAKDPAAPGKRIESGDLVIDPEKRRVTVEGNPVHLTAREFELLQEFARHPGRVYTRAQLLDKVWGYSYQGYEHTVNSHINRLREKIEKNPAKPRYILTVRGVGYRFAEPGDRETG